jgi:hypothetical protein
MGLSGSKTSSQGKNTCHNGGYFDRFYVQAVKQDLIHLQSFQKAIAELASDKEYEIIMQHFSAYLKKKWGLD